jgi:hypothetical protein
MSLTALERGQAELAPNLLQPVVAWPFVEAAAGGLVMA